MNLSPFEKEMLFWIMSRNEDWGVKFTFNSKIFLNNSTQYLYSCSLEKLGKDALGYGCDENRRRAQIKAAVEAIERQLVMDNNWRHTNGVALNPDSKAASLSALYESYERDAFFCHFLTQTAFSLLVSPKAEENWKKDFDQKSTEIFLRRAHSHPGVHVIIAFLSSPKDGVGIVIGMGAHAEEEKAILHAQKECLGLFTFLKKSSPLNFSIKDFYSKKDLTLFDHALLGTDLDYGEWFKEKYIKNDIPYSSSTSIIPEIICEKIKGDKYQDCPLYVAKVDGKDLQFPYWGAYPAELNIERLITFSKGKWKPGSLPEFTHCFA